MYNEENYFKLREHSDSVVEYLTQNGGAAGLSLTGITVMCPRARHIYPCLVLVSTQEYQSRHNCKNVDLDVKNHIKQTNQNLKLMTYNNYFGMIKW